MLPPLWQKGQLQQRVQKNADALGRLVIRLGWMRFEEAVSVELVNGLARSAFRQFEIAMLTRGVMEVDEERDSRP